MLVVVRGWMATINLRGQAMPLCPSAAGGYTGTGRRGAAGCVLGCDEWSCGVEEPNDAAGFVCGGPERRNADLKESRLSMNATRGPSAPGPSPSAVQSTGIGNGGRRPPPSDPSGDGPVCVGGFRADPHRSNLSVTSVDTGPRGGGGLGGTATGVGHLMGTLRRDGTMGHHGDVTTHEQQALVALCTSVGLPKILCRLILILLVPFGSGAETK